MPSWVQHAPGPGCTEPQSCLGEEEVEVPCRVREVAVVVRHQTLIGVVEVVGEACLDRRAVVVVEVEVFQAREEVVGVHQTPQVAVEEAAAVGTG